MRTLVPGYETPAAPTIGTARPATAGPETLGGAARLARPIDAKRWLLWATLVLGVVVLGWMAWRLSGQLDAAAKGAADAAGREAD
jgi:hypothetical protein